MSRFLLQSYDTLTEIALWVLFIGAAIGGYSAAGIGGLIGFVAAAFVISVFLVAPFMMISDIRKTVAKIEAQRSPEHASAGAEPAQLLPKGAKPSTEEEAQAQKTDSGLEDQFGFDENGMLEYRGMTIQKVDNKFQVGDQFFSTFGKAKRYISNQA